MNQEPHFSEEYPEMIHYLGDIQAIPKHNDIQQNVFIHVKQIHNGQLEWGLVHDENFITDRDPEFKNVTRLNLSLEKITFEKI